MEEDLSAAPAEPESGEDQAPKTEIRPARGRTFLPEVTGVEFSGSRRGYDRAEVDQYVERVSRIVVELEAMRSPDAVIERALADVGEETSAILRRARKAAEEIIADAEANSRERSEHAEARARDLREEADHYNARVRADAEQVLSEANAESERIVAEARDEAASVREQAGSEAAQMRQEATTEATHARQEATSEATRVRQEATTEATRLRGDADRYRAQVSAHIDQLAQERHRLIEDLRKLADQFHRTADRALEQIPSQDVSYEGREGNGGGASTQARSG